MRRSITLAVVAAVVAAAVSGCSRSDRTASGGHRQVEVIAGDDGFKPASVEVRKGEHLVLVFKRTTDETCAKDVVFPELGIKKPLPLNQPVAIDVPTGEARKLGFECGMGMYKSAVVVK